MTELSEREFNLIASAIGLVEAARRGGHAHVTAWQDAILARTATPEPADVDELVALRGKLCTEKVAGLNIFRAGAAR